MYIVFHKIKGSDFTLMVRKSDINKLCNGVKNAKISGPYFVHKMIVNISH